MSDDAKKLPPPITPEQRAWIDAMNKVDWGGRKATAEEAQALEREVEAARVEAARVNERGAEEARNAPVVGTSSSGARIVRVAKMGWTTHPDDRGAPRGGRR